MAGEPGITDQLNALVSGKRRAPRRDVDLIVRLKAVEREFDAIARDLSVGGALLEMSEEELSGVPGSVLGPVDQLALVETHFRDSFDVHFPEFGAVAEASLVRLSVRPELPGCVFLGCQFAEALSEVLQRRLGLIEDHPSVESWDDVDGLASLPLVVDPTRPLTLLIFDEAHPVAGPRTVGQVDALGPRALVVRLDGTSTEDVTRQLAGRSHPAQIMHGMCAVWSGSATLLATRFVDGPSPGAEVALACDRPPGRKVRKFLRRRRR